VAAVKVTSSFSSVCRCLEEKFCSTEGSVRLGLLVNNGTACLGAFRVKWQNIHLVIAIGQTSVELRLYMAYILPSLYRYVTHHTSLVYAFYWLILNSSRHPSSISQTFCLRCMIMVMSFGVAPLLNFTQ
jgi:hypothetical protein